MNKIASYALAAVSATAIGIVSDPAMAQFAGGAATAPFQTGLTTLLNWVYIVGVIVAIGSLIFAAIALFAMRNVMLFAGALLGLVVGGTLIAQAPEIVSALTGLQALI